MLDGAYGAAAGLHGGLDYTAEEAIEGAMVLLPAEHQAIKGRQGRLL